MFREVSRRFFHTLAIVLIDDVTAEWLSGMQILSPIHPHVYLQLDSMRVISLTTLAVVVDDLGGQFLDAIGRTFDGATLAFQRQGYFSAYAVALEPRGISEDQ